MPKSPIYVGVFLDGASRDNLLALVPSKHSKVFADHLTLAFGKAMKDSYPLGLPVTLYAWGAFSDGNGQAVVCWPKGVEHLLAEGQLPHITLSCASGIPPNYSNEMLALVKQGGLVAQFDYWQGPIKLTGVIDYFPRTL